MLGVRTPPFSVTAPASTPDVALDVENNARAEAVQVHWQFSHAVQAVAYRTLVLGGTDDKQKAAAARTGQLGASCSCLQRSHDRNVNLVVRHPGGKLPLGLPAFAHCGSECVHVAAAQPVGGQARKVAQQVKLRAGGFDIRALLDQNRVRAPGYAGVEEHDLLLERPALGRGYP